MSIYELERRLGYKFKNSGLVKQALTHRSYMKADNNERLEFLGDAVLNLTVGEYLYSKFPLKTEGELSRLRSSLVSEKGFKDLAMEIELGKYILISPSEENNHGRVKASILANAFEALMGAVYLEGGLPTVEKITIGLFEKVYPVIDIETLFKDYKTILQETTQAHFGVTPEYVLLGSYGPDHKKEFDMAVTIRGKELARSRGGTKKEAEQSAAGKALEMIEKEID